MSRRQNDPLRPLTDEETAWLTRLSRSHTEPVAHVARAKALLAVAAGKSYTDAALAAGRRSGDAVAHLVARFNRDGLAAVGLRHGGGPPRRIGEAERARIVSEARRVPTPEQDGTATWSVSLLQRALRQAGLNVGRYAIWAVLREAGFTWQRHRTWCETGRAQRKRKAGRVTVTDPDAEAKKNADRGRVSRRRTTRVSGVGRR
jgi:transposase